MPEYKCIEAWGKLLHSHDYYIRGQIKEAKKDNAPEDAIYKKQDGSWATLSDVSNEEVKRLIAASYYNHSKT